MWWYWAEHEAESQGKPIIAAPDSSLQPELYCCWSYPPPKHLLDHFQYRNCFKGLIFSKEVKAQITSMDRLGQQRTNMKHARVFMYAWWGPLSLVAFLSLAQPLKAPWPGESPSNLVLCWLALHWLLWDVCTVQWCGAEVMKLFLPWAAMSTLLITAFEILAWLPATVYCISVIPQSSWLQFSFISDISSIYFLSQVWSLLFTWFWSHVKCLKNLKSSSQ